MIGEFDFDFQTRDDGDSHADVVFSIAMLSLQMLSCEVVVA